MAIISAIGGTMGLCIGFSFTNLSSFILSYVEIGLKRWNNRGIKANIVAKLEKRHSEDKMGQINEQMWNMDKRLMIIEKFWKQN